MLCFDGCIGEISHIHQVCKLPIRRQMHYYTPRLGKNMAFFSFEQFKFRVFSTVPVEQPYFPEKSEAYRKEHLPSHIFQSSIIPIFIAAT